MAVISTADGNELYVRVVGQGEPVILLHGFGMDSRSWLPFVSTMLHQYKFILPDLRGHGKNNHINPGACSLTQSATDLKDIIQQLNLKDVALAGISMGAYVGLQYHKLTDFHHIKKYAHMEQSPYWRTTNDWRYGLFGEDQDKWLSMIKDLHKELGPRRYETPYTELPTVAKSLFWRIIREFAVESSRKPINKIIAQLTLEREPIARKVMNVTHWSHYLQCIDSLFSYHHDMRTTVPDISIPVTVMVGAKSKVYPPKGQHYFKTLLPKAKVIEFKNSGHAIFADEPLKFHRELRNFIRH